MRSYVLSSRVRLLLKAASVGVLGGVVAGCSSDFSRFDTSVYNSVVPQDSAQSSNPYPGDVDRTTTAGVYSSGVKRRIIPSASVAPAVVPQAVYHTAEPTYAAPQNGYPPARQPLNAYTPTQTYTQPAPYTAPKPASSWSNNSAIKSTSLLETAKAKVIKPEPVQVQAKPESGYSKLVKKYTQPVTTDPVTTAAIQPIKTDRLSAAVPQPVNNITSQAPTNGGWTSTGGTRISVRQGETLYNLSKRYGVPVNELEKANNLTRTDSIRAGQQILIPNYIFSSTSPVSAPDNNPGTRAARASTGYLGEASLDSVSVPTKRPFKPYEVAAVSPSGDVGESNSGRYQPKIFTGPSNEETTPDYGIVTGSVSSDHGASYVVKGGDSLSKIAKSYGTSVAQLQRANGLSGSAIRVGQKLNIPVGIDNTVTASVKAQNHGVDPIVTGSTAKPASEVQTARLDTETKAPAQTGISDFRWPVRGRVVSTFGERQQDGTNDGIDISVPEGTAVRAAENGVVIYTGTEISKYGQLVLVRHTEGWVSAYAHNSEFEVKKGDKVRRGQIIARSGKTGDADRPKLHFELRKDSNPVDPKKHLTGA